MNRDEVEDFLHERGVFFNGLRGKDSHAHMDSYMTCINWKKLEIAFKELRSKLTRENLTELIRQWELFSYCSPNCGILSKMFKYWMKQEVVSNVS